jgi:maltose phosphorylase
MNQDYIKPDNWSIIEEEGFVKHKVIRVFSVNGAMGRANFEELYRRTFRKLLQELSDKTQVGWWKLSQIFCKVFINQIGLEH